MRYRHFEELRPVCPHCLRSRGAVSPLLLGVVEVEEPGGVRWGTLLCSDTDCGLEYPVIDGIPVLVPDVRGWMAANGHLVLARSDLPPVLEGVVGDASGPDSAFNITRQHLSSYGWDHYGDLDPAHPEDSRAGAVARCLAAGLERIVSGLGEVPEGPVLDLGCAVGRSSFELAERCGGLVLGLDMNWPLLALARRVLETGEADYPLRRVGIVYDRRRVPVTFAGMERVDFWLADALTPPFAPERFGLVAALNVLDCVSSPPALLHAIERSVAPGGAALLATPFDWATQATPVEAWLGGHSQRGDDSGDGEAVLRRLLTPGVHPQSVARMELVGEPWDLPWQVRLHARARMEYLSYIVAMRASA